MYLRLHFVVEGQTEETFANTVLRDHFAHQSIATAAHCVTTRRRRGATYRGGLATYQHARNDIRRWAEEDGNADARFTTMFDLYKLPGDFPDHAVAARSSDPYRRVEILETALRNDIGDRRFIPYIQLHEFEALLFADPQRLEAQFPDRQSAIRRLIATTDHFDSPELVNDGPTTAPSKRIIEMLPEYEGRKASAGPITARQIGLPTLQSKCRHFREWLERLVAPL